MFSYLINRFRGLLLAAAIVSIVSGACGVLLVSQINMALTVEHHSAALAWTFAGLARGRDAQPHPVLGVV